MNSLGFSNTEYALLIYGILPALIAFVKVSQALQEKSRKDGEGPSLLLVLAYLAYWSGYFVASCSIVISLSIMLISSIFFGMCVLTIALCFSFAIVYNLPEL